MAISTNPKLTIYRSLYDYTGPTIYSHFYSLLIVVNFKLDDERSFSVESYMRWRHTRDVDAMSQTLKVSLDDL